MEFDGRLRAVMPLLFMTRDIALQRDGCEELTQLATVAEQLRLAMLAEGRMDEALRSLGARYLAEGFRRELLIYICLKEGDPDKAWDNLVGAQISYNYAVRSHPAFQAQLHFYVERLARIENDIFPKQVFLSAGLIVREQECTICSANYETCDHVSGEIYNAEFCHVRLKNVTPDHVSFVDEPANKMCRVTHYSAEGGQRNRMTWAIAPDEKKTSDPIPEDALQAAAIV